MDEARQSLTMRRAGWDESEMPLKGERLHKMRGFASEIRVNEQFMTSEKVVGRSMREPPNRLKRCINRLVSVRCCPWLVFSLGGQKTPTGRRFDEGQLAMLFQWLIGLRTRVRQDVAIESQSQRLRILGPLLPGRLDQRLARDAVHECLVLG
jgi:hypothetical protein